MDGDFFAERECGAIDEILGMLDPGIGNVLRQLSHRKSSEVSGELVSEYNMKALLETRTEVFRASLDKVDLCLSQVAKARDDDAITLSTKEQTMIDKAERLYRSLSPRDMIKRKCPKKLTNDILELLRFIGREDLNLPLTMMKPTVIPKGKRGPMGPASMADLKCLQEVAHRITDTHLFNQEGEMDTEELCTDECVDLNVSPVACDNISCDEKSDDGVYATNENDSSREDIMKAQYKDISDPEKLETPQDTRRSVEECMGGKQIGHSESVLCDISSDISGPLMDNINTIRAESTRKPPETLRAGSTESNKPPPMGSARRT